MGFEDSMIEAGFHDEEDYLEHLMDEFDKQNETQQEYDEDINDEYDEEWPDGYYEEESNRYYKWFRENPIKKELFIAWAYTFYEAEKNNDFFFVDRFMEWEQDEEGHIERLKNYWGKEYEALLSFIVWKQENPMEEILRQPQHEYFDFRYDPPLELSESEVLEYDVEDFKNWINRKKEFEKWFTNTSEEKKREFLNEVDYNEFDDDKSIENIRLCIIKQMDDDKEPDFIKQKVLDWYDSQPEEAGKLFYHIKCVQYY